MNPKYRAQDSDFFWKIYDFAHIFLLRLRIMLAHARKTE